MTHETNPETGSDIEYDEESGDFTITFGMSLPTPPPADDDRA